MTRTAMLVAITLISAVATPVVVNATTPKPKAGVAAAAVAAAQDTPACARPVRVVYAGYGEGQGTACIASAR
jgi:hypothetical protein